LSFNFNNSYTHLAEQLFSKQNPTIVKAPKVVVFNDELANSLGLSFTDKQHIAQLFSGNEIPSGAEPIAQAYAGHQFGHFTMLGDGRAILLGEHITPNNIRVDVQLKGSGRTPYSRSGDGKATLSAMLREYLISEAMHHLCVPTSRSLAVVSTGEDVAREFLQEGAVLTRIASSHIRVGTFEYVKKFMGKDALEQFTHYVIERHYPQIKASKNPPLELLKSVMHRQTDLIVNWMRVGFIHGVMNTDNMTVSGETIDYGPCAFMNAYHPKTVFSSIDSQGRYAFGNQPAIAHWNLMCFASALLPLINENSEKAIEQAQKVLDTFASIYEEKWLNMMRKKLGLTDVSDEDAALISELLKWMEAHQADYTNTFFALQNETLPNEGIYSSAAFLAWYAHWQKRISHNTTEALDLMRQHNPVYIPRNHLVEQALEAASNQNDYTLFHQLLNVLSEPYTYRPEFSSFQSPPPDGDHSYQTFCGT
jgi:serine/tyrosine/threonine adenylyltransferase